MIITQVSSLHLPILLKQTIKIKEIQEEGETTGAEVVDRKPFLIANFASNRVTRYSTAMKDSIKTSRNRTTKSLCLDNNQETQIRRLISQTHVLLKEIQMLGI